MTTLRGLGALATMTTTTTRRDVAVVTTGVLVLLMLLVVALNHHDASSSALDGIAADRPHRDPSVSSTDYWRVGVGRADITPPIGEINMMGYANVGQKANGIHLRTYARAFIFSSGTAEDANRRVVFVNSDTAAGSYVTKTMALELLAEELGDDEASHYTNDNVMISSTHSHSGTGAYCDDFLYQVTSYGVHQPVREAIARGYARAIARAHRDWSRNANTTAVVEISEGFLDDASINRAAFAYDNNPLAERKRYRANVDHNFPVVAIWDSERGGSAKVDRRLRGALSWFPVHGTSMNSTNELVSGDNKGAASYLWELEERLNGNPDFVAAFCQSNAGDVSPNTSGGHCLDTGEECDATPHSCDDDPNQCVARGPGYEEGGMMLSTKIIGSRQFVATKSAALGTRSITLTGSNVEFRHAFVDMTNVNVTLQNGTTLRTCKPTMGGSFAAGTIDGPGSNLATQGSNKSHPLLGFIGILLATKPSEDLVKCQAPKPILLATGAVNRPYTWQPFIVPLQLFLIGRKLAIVGLPGEITTMAGRRLRENVKAVLVDDGSLDSDGVVIIAGLSNQYASYCTTFEEYQKQSYEAASTPYGPHTLQAYIHLFTKMAHSFKDPSAGVPKGSPPPEHDDVSLISPVFADIAHIGHSFGDVLQQPDPTVRIGGKVRSAFACAHPRNGDGDWSAEDGRSSFMTIERHEGANNMWEAVMGDEVWDTTYEWERVGVAASLCKLGWSVGETVPVVPGTYRFRIYGMSRIALPVGHDILRPFTGVSDSFEVVE